MKYEERPPRLAIGICICLFAYIFFVTASSLVWSFRKAFPTIEIIFFQNCISFFCILPLSLRKGILRLKTDIISLHLVRDVAGVLSYYLYFVAIRYLNLSDATTLNYSAPFFVPIIWWIWMRERIEVSVWWSIVIGFLGVAVILNPTSQIFQEGFVFGLTAGVMSAVAFVSLRILNLNKEPMSRTLFYYFLFGTLFSAPFAYLYWVQPSGLQWVKIAGVGLATVIAQMLLTIAYRFGTASFLSPLGYLSVVYAGISSWLIFHIPPSLQSVIGTIFIIIGGTCTYILKKKPKKVADTFKVLDQKEKPPL